MKTKYKCQRKRKSGNSKFYINSVKDLSSAPTKGVIRQPFYKLLTSFLVRACFYAIGQSMSLC